MKATLLGLFLVSVFGITGSRLPAQQAETNAPSPADIRAKAESGDAQAQYELGRMLKRGTRAVTQDYAEAVRCALCHPQCHPTLFFQKSRRPAGFWAP